MKFTIDTIAAEHKKVKSGADFPEYIQAVKGLGVSHYKVYVSDGNTEYFDHENKSVSSGSKYGPLNVSDEVNAERFKMQLKLHQLGGTNYMTFCKDCADNGVAGWKMDLNAMVCTYFDQAENNILEEQVPGRA
ncbi:DUF1398 domain-containing protein [Chryseobacterium pennipullorum]|uniref:Phage envelope protein n=1 Tax=Chryseobacterium pennipullorum TaxID=2258963 RepID=A0A3D9B9T0_9FLAO|nr:DUF1398 family protein [Chryseobacterium pennipullorum]REC50353.1 phage envelope protein [Chryseobacterium pennipullorum]